MAENQSATKTSNGRHSGPQRPSGELEIGRDVVEYLKEYAREKPEVAALWCFGVGFILGWKLKPW